jgi:hypothetical protein
MSKLKHGHTSRVDGRNVMTPEYKAFAEAKQRCTNKAHRYYEQYGGRGIQFRFESFEQFIEHIGLRPSVSGKKRSLYSLDRIDNNRNYAVGNVRWATNVQQRHNQRRSSQITKLNWDAVEHIRASNSSHAALAKEYNVSDMTIRRIRSGQSWKIKPEVQLPLAA